MTTESITSPPAKRVKTDANPSTTTDTTMAETNTNTPAVPNLETSPQLMIKKLSDKARLPTRGSAFAAGYDLYASNETVVPARGKVLVDTDIAIAVPAGTYGRIAPRSGLASKNFIDTGAGVIDADYRGQVKVLLFNHGETDFAISEGDRVAQLIIERIYTPEILEVAELDASEGGHGSAAATWEGGGALAATALLRAAIQKVVTFGKWFWAEFEDPEAQRAENEVRLAERMLHTRERKVAFNEGWIDGVRHGVELGRLNPRLRQDVLKELYSAW
ncbi:Uu.00g039660.m01.CDS01 [Anthostomella pinea]|uniref:Deoxyuridine 5'-triphosphate nucleotidohydrolase n=1 Tax=Anthostomella pinea TaxID=933095 RepID=A0AAI8V536_9PEZI|nr:Uu.00g039660.m01.CDS01 [Anthostomella pinea]